VLHRGNRKKLRSNKEKRINYWGKKGIQTERGKAEKENT
jgi:hypothetical protein